MWAALIAVLAEFGQGSECRAAVSDVSERY